MKYQQVILSIIVLFIAVQLPLVAAYAQSASSGAKIPGDASGSDSKTVSSYQLPYPGMLPDNPLYFLKVIRDNLTSFFISKPLAKASFDLLQSDKDVEASYLLVTHEQGKGDLALETFSQSENYFEDALKQTQSAKKQGYSTIEISRRLQEAQEEHVQMLQSLGQQLHQENTQSYRNELHQAEMQTQMVKALVQ
jgi:hypothetical protein